MNGYMMRPQFVRVPKVEGGGGNLIVGPFQLNWYDHGLRLHVTWPRMRTLTLR